MYMLAMLAALRSAIWRHMAYGIYKSFILNMHCACKTLYFWGCLMDIYLSHYEVIIDIKILCHKHNKSPHSSLTTRVGPCPVFSNMLTLISLRLAITSYLPCLPCIAEHYYASLRHLTDSSSSAHGESVKWQTRHLHKNSMLAKLTRADLLHRLARASLRKWLLSVWTYTSRSCLRIPAYTCPMVGWLLYVHMVWYNRH